MKGLLTKDIRLILGQKQLFLLALVFTIFFIVQEKAAFSIGYLTMLVGMMAITTITFDESDNGSAFLFTMPISRRGYVVEKYVLGLGLGAVSCLLVTVLVIALGHVRHTEMDITEFIGTAVGIFVSLALMLAILLPMIFRYGAERGRLAFALIVAVAVVAVFRGIDWMADNSDVAGALSWLDKLGAIGLIGMAVLVLAAVLCISMFISIRIVEKKQF